MYKYLWIIRVEIVMCFYREKVALWGVENCF